MADPLDISPDEDMAIRTVIGEAKGEGDRGWRAVAGVIKNRAAGSGKSLRQVVLAPSQFEPWSVRKRELMSYDRNSPTYLEVAASVLPVLRSEISDPTGGATHFYAPTAQQRLGRSKPAWDNGTGEDIGNHRFFRLGYGGGGKDGIEKAPADTKAAGGGMDPSNVVVVGDSVAHGLRLLGGKKLPGLTEEGKDAETVFNKMVMKLDPNSQIKGRDIIISPGSLNSGKVDDWARASISYLQGMGAKSVTIAGGGNRSDIAGVSPALSDIAKETGARFLPAGPTTRDRLHPDSYSEMLNRGLAGTAPSPSTDSPKPAISAPPPKQYPIIGSDRGEDPLADPLNFVRALQRTPPAAASKPTLPGSGAAPAPGVFSGANLPIAVPDAAMKPVVPAAPSDPLGDPASFARAMKGIGPALATPGSPMSATLAGMTPPAGLTSQVTPPVAAGSPAVAVPPAQPLAPPAARPSLVPTAQARPVARGDGAGATTATMPIAPSMTMPQAEADDGAMRIRVTPGQFDPGQAWTGGEAPTSDPDSALGFSLQQAQQGSNPLANLARLLGLG